MREDDAARFEFASKFVAGRATQVKSEIAALEGDLLKITKDDRSIVDAKSGTRNEFMKSLGRKLDATVTGFNAFRTDPQLKQIRIDLAERSDKTTFADTKGGTYSCPDSQLSGALKGVVRAIDGLPELDKPKIATVEGSEATIEAFRRLTSTFHGLMTFKMPPSADEQREMQKRAVQSVESPQLAARIAATGNLQPGLSQRDWVPLAVALFVDLCLLLVSMGRPMNRLQGLLPKMRAAEQGPVIQILSRFSEIHRDAGMRESFEVLRHVVFDYAGAYYVAVPLDAPFTETRREQVVDPKSRKARLVSRQIALTPSRRDDLRTEAHLIANLFSSFEKDNVFKRVMWLNLDSARRRLQQQGSKFANSEAFRIYRFADGAWSEIILGAVMGAARRVEQARASDPDAYGRREPSLDALADRMRQAEIEAQDKGVPQAKPVFEPGQWAGLSEREVDPGLQAQFGPYAGVAQAERGQPGTRNGYDARDYANSNTRTDARGVRDYPAPAQFNEGLSIGPGAQIPGHDGEGPDNIVPFKPVQPGPAARAVFEDGEAGGERDDMRLPNILSRGQTVLAQRIDQVADQSDVPDATAQGVTVTATERKLSFELPVSDERLPRGLLDIAGILARDAKPDAPVETAQAPEISGDINFLTPVTITAQPERQSGLALPAPIRAREQRG